MCEQINDNIILLSGPVEGPSVPYLGHHLLDDTVQIYYLRLLVFYAIRAVYAWTDLRTVTKKLRRFLNQYQLRAVGRHKSHDSPELVSLSFWLEACE